MASCNCCTCCAGSVWYIDCWLYQKKINIIHCFARHIHTRRDRKKPIAISLMWLKWPSFDFFFFLLTFMSGPKVDKNIEYTSQQSKLCVFVCVRVLDVFGLCTQWTNFSPKFYLLFWLIWQPNNNHFYIFCFCFFFPIVCILLPKCLPQHLD